MRMPRTPQAYRTLDAYRDAPRSERFGVKIRWLTSPVAAVERHVPRSGRILDVGCGYGLASLYLAVCSSDREVVGVDIDAPRIALAQQAARHVDDDDRGEPAGSVEFHAIEAASWPDGTFDCVAINLVNAVNLVDPLGPDRRRSVIDAGIDRLTPGGTILITGAGTFPRWKARIAEIHVDYARAGELVDQLEGRGLVASTLPIDNGYPYPHVLVTGRSRT